MTELEEKITLWLRENPGARKREIAGVMRMWHMSSAFRDAMRNLENNGFIRYETYRDPAQMELYDKWYVVAP